MRRIAPAHFLTEAILSLAPLDRLLYLGLFLYCDKAGRVLDRPLELKQRVLPADDIDVNAALARLAKKGLLRRYKVDRLRIVALDEALWLEVQDLHPKEPLSGLPAPSPVKSRASRGVRENLNPHDRGVPRAGSSGSSSLRDPRAFEPAGSAAVIDLRADARAASEGTPEKTSDAELDRAWDALIRAFDALDLQPPELDPIERAGRVRALLRGLPTEETDRPAGLAQIAGVAFAREAARDARNPLAYLQTMLADAKTRRELLDQLDELREQKIVRVLESAPAGLAETELVARVTGSAPAISRVIATLVDQATCRVDGDRIRLSEHESSNPNPDQEVAP